MLSVRQPARSNHTRLPPLPSEGPRLAAYNDVSQQWCDPVRAAEHYIAAGAVRHMKQASAGNWHARASRSASAASWRRVDSQCMGMFAIPAPPCALQNRIPHVATYRQAAIIFALLSRPWP